MATNVGRFVGWALLMQDSKPQFVYALPNRPERKFYILPISLFHELGVGIPGMKARMRHFGGRLDVRGRPSGTIVHAVVSV